MHLHLKLWGINLANIIDLVYHANYHCIKITITNSNSIADILLEKQKHILCK